MSLKSAIALATTAAITLSSLTCYVAHRSLYEHDHLPRIVQKYDVNNNGILDRSEIESMLKDYNLEKIQIDRKN